MAPLSLPSISRIVESGTHKKRPFNSRIQCVLSSYVFVSFFLPETFRFATRSPSPSKSLFSYLIFLSWRYFQPENHFVIFVIQRSKQWVKTHIISFYDENISFCIISIRKRKLCLIFGYLNIPNHHCQLSLISARTQRWSRCIGCGRQGL